MSIKQNITSLQNLLEQVNSLPEAGGVELPPLVNEGSAADLMFGKELIDTSGSKVTGTFSLDTELNAQNSLISQIQTAVDGLPEAGGGSIETVTGIISLGKFGALEGVRIGYTNQYQVFVEDMYYEDTVINVVKNTVIYVDETYTAVGGVNYCGYIEAQFAYSYIAYSNFDVLQE